MRSIYDGEHTLNAITRGYKVTGRKLAAKDAHTVFEMRSLGCRNTRQLKQALAAERNYYSDPKNFPGVVLLSTVERKLHLSTRSIKTVQTAFMLNQDVVGRTRNRYLNALYNDYHSKDVHYEY